MNSGCFSSHSSIKTFKTMDKTVKILAIQNEIEALLLDDILNERGIPHIMKSYRDIVYDGLWQTDTSWGHIEAPEKYRDEILEIFNSIKQ